MDCASCKALLNELRHGELPSRTEAEARSHLAQCKQCRGAHMRLLRDDELASGAPSAPSAPGSLMTRAAFAWVRSLRPKAKPLIPRTVDHPLAGHGALGALGRLAMAPQVAMSTVMLLIVLVGLWSLPQLTRKQAPRFGDRFDSEGVKRISTETGSASARSERQLARAQLDPTRGMDATGATRKPGAADDATGLRRDKQGARGERRKSDFDLAMQHYRAHEYALATPFFSRALVSPTSNTEHAQALLYVARAERALGHCDRAVNSYDTLVRVHPGRLEAAAALREGVACYDKLGEGGRAQRLLDQAAATPQLVASARRLWSDRAAASARRARVARSGPAATTSATATK